MAHTHDIFSTKQRSTWAQWWCCVWTKPAFVRTQLCFVRTVYARREAEICSVTFWLREDEAELCPIEHFRKDTALLRPVHMTAGFSSLHVQSNVGMLSTKFSINGYMKYLIIKMYYILLNQSKVMLECLALNSVQMNKDLEKVSDFVKLKIWTDIFNIEFNRNKLS